LPNSLRKFPKLQTEEKGQSRRETEGDPNFTSTLITFSPTTKRQKTMFLRIVIVLLYICSTSSFLQNVYKCTNVQYSTKQKESGLTLGIKKRYKANTKQNQSNKSKQTLTADIKMVNHDLEQHNVQHNVKQQNIKGKKMVTWGTDQQDEQKEGQKEDGQQNQRDDGKDDKRDPQTGKTEGLGD
jgi:hypothetical protein